MFKEVFFDTAVIACIIISSGFSIPLLFGAIKELLHNPKNME